MWRRGLQTAAIARGAGRSCLPWTVGTRTDGYRVVSISPIKPFDMTMFQLIHEETGAQHVHIDTADTNNTFAVVFRTPPAASNGIAHILEHTVLCGSQAYPVRDPFFHMLRRSLQNFMNAMTGPDYTMYPFSTCHQRDYDNLLRIYCDATFFPLLTLNDFRQEGHRLEHEIWNDPKSPVVIKGIVYNEMKGAMSDSASILHEEMAARLFPDTAYRFNSGGDPVEIPKLTHEDLLKFHKEHYHPSNSRFYTYGDMAPPLSFLNESVLSKFQRQTLDTGVDLQARFDSAPPVHSFYGPPDSMIVDPNKQTCVTQSFLCADIPSSDPVDITAMSLASSLLLRGADSPFHRALIQPNIGNGFSPVTGLMPTRQMVWSVGLQGIASSDVTRVTDLIRSTLRDTIITGFEQRRIDAVTHQYQLNQQEIKTKFGLDILYRVMPRWIHGGDPLKAMQLDEHLKEIAMRQSRGPYLQQLVRSHLFDNTHCVTTVMNPDPEYMQKRALIEQKMLQDISVPLDLVSRAKELVESQETMSNVDCLPTLRTADIEPQNPNECLDIGIESHSSGDIHFVNQSTNGIVYTDMLFSVDDVPSELHALLPLYCSLVGSVGCAGRTYQEQSHLKTLYTGGASASLHAFSPVNDLKSHSQAITFHSSCLTHNASKMLTILTDMAASADFTDFGRLRQLITDAAASLSAAVVDSGHAYARTHASSQYSSCLSAHEQYHGLTHAALISSIASKISCPLGGEDALAELSRNLTAINSSLRLARSAVVADRAVAESIKPELFSHLDSLPSYSCSSLAPIVLPKRVSALRNFIGVSQEVHNVALAIPSDVPYGHVDSAALRVLTRIMSTEYLHRELREKGGAYGGGASWSPDGAIQFYSFRDPHVQSTIDTFADAVKWCQDPNHVTADVLEQSLLSIFASLNAPIHPCAQGHSQFVKGIARDQRIEHRQRLLGLRPEMVTETAKRYFNDFDIERASVTVVGNEDNMSASGRASDPLWSLMRLSDMAPATSHVSSSCSADTPPTSS